MSDIVERLKFDAARCELQFSKGVAGNISEAAAEIERLRVALRAVDDLLKIIEHDDMLASDARDVIRAAIDEQAAERTDG